MRHRLQLDRYVAQFWLLMLAVVALVVGGLTVLDRAQAQAPPEPQALGRVENCVTDATGWCTIQHGLGVAPDSVAVQVSSNRSAFTRVSVPSITDEQYRVRFTQRNGSGFAAVAMEFLATYVYTPGGPTPTPTATTPMPTPGPCIVPGGITINEGESPSFPDRDGTGEYLVHNNNWNDVYGGSHVIHACTYDTWDANVSIPNHADNGVDAYLNVHRDYDDFPTAGIQSVDFAGHGPKCAGCIYNVAFDIWVGQGLSHELMIWTENWNQRPAGNPVDTITVAGYDYQVWRSGSGDGGIITYLSLTEQLSGNMPLQPFFADARARGWTPTTTWQVDFGVETVDTNGTPQWFDFDAFTIHD